jgi:hypothetical protein
MHHRFTREELYNKVAVKSRRPLTNTAIQSAKPRDRAYKLFDERGLYLLVSPNGTRAWRFKYQFDGKEKLLSLGVFPDVSLKSAREKRDGMRALVAGGIDPSAKRQAEKIAQADTLSAIAAEWMSKRSGEWSADHLTRTKSRLSTYIFPKLVHSAAGRFELSAAHRGVRAARHSASNPAAGR